MRTALVTSSERTKPCLGSKFYKSLKTSLRLYLKSCRCWWARFSTWCCNVPHGVAKWFEELTFVVWFESKFPAWQAGVVAAIFVGALALIFNLLFLILATRKHKPGLNGLGTLLEGDCKRIDKWNKIAHGFINVMSTVKMNDMLFGRASC